MTHALVTDGTISVLGALPDSARRIDTGDWVMGLATAPPELVAATGWSEVTDVPQPADTATTTYDRSVELVDGTPTVTWTERPKTQDELDAAQRSENRDIIADAITAALVRLQQLVDAPDVPPVPDGTMTTAQLSNAMRTMRTMVQQNRDGAQEVALVLKRTIRLVRGDFDGTG